jgi:hypothetical protein
MSLVIAESLDDCLGDHLDTSNVSTVEIVKQSLNEQKPPASFGESSEMTASAAKQWCTDISQRLPLSASALSTNSKEAVLHLQNVLVASVCGKPADSLTVSKSETKEEADSPELKEKLSDWCATLVRKLESCVDDIEDQDIDESTRHASADNYDGESSDESIDELAHSTKRVSSMKRNVDSAYDAIDSTNFMALVDDQKKRTEADDSDSVHSDDNVWKQATSHTQSNQSSNMDRVLRASLISTFNEAVTSGKLVSASQIEPLLKSMRNSHFDVHRDSIDVKVQTNAATDNKLLVSNGDNIAKKIFSGVQYLVLALAVFSIGAFIAFKLDFLL